MNLTKEFLEKTQDPDDGSFLMDEDIDQILKNQVIVEKLKKRYNQFGKLTITEMTIRTWTPGQVTTLLEEILGNE